MAEPNDDELLVEQFSRGDESVFERIVELYSADVAALANRLLGWPGDVEDLTQDVFLAAFLGLKKFRRDCKLRTWLFTITINKCRSFRQRQRLHLRPLPQSPKSWQSPMNAEDFDRVRRAVATMPAKSKGGNQIDSLNNTLTSLSLQIAQYKSQVDGYAQQLFQAEELLGKADDYELLSLKADIAKQNLQEVIVWRDRLSRQVRILQPPSVSVIGG